MGQCQSPSRPSPLRLTSPVMKDTLSLEGKQEPAQGVAPGPILTWNADVCSKRV